MKCQAPGGVKAAFHDTDIDIIAKILARMSVLVSLNAAFSLIRSNCWAPETLRLSQFVRTSKADVFLKNCLKLRAADCVVLTELRAVKEIQRHREDERSRRSSPSKLTRLQQQQQRVHRDEKC